MSKEEKKEEGMTNDELISGIIAGVGFVLFCISFVWIVSNLDFVWLDDLDCIITWGHHFSFLARDVVLKLICLFGATLLLISETLYWTSKDNADGEETIYGKTLKVKTTALEWGFLANVGVWGYILIFMTSIDKYGVGGTINGVERFILSVCIVILASVLIYTYIYINSYKFRRQVKPKKK
jgi:hypothetical protein